MPQKNSSRRWLVLTLVALTLASTSAYSTARVKQSYSLKADHKNESTANADQPLTEVANDLAVGSQKQEDSKRNKDVAVSPKYAWSKQAQVYHYFNCAWVKKIKPENLQTGNTPPEGRRLHRGCPTTEIHSRL